MEADIKNNDLKKRGRTTKEEKKTLPEKVCNLRLTRRNTKEKYNLNPAQPSRT
jgi:hypothetical protein